MTQPDRRMLPALHATVTLFLDELRHAVSSGLVDPYAAAVVCRNATDKLHDLADQRMTRGQ